MLDTDYSGNAIGGVLSQKQDGKERVILYSAQKLLPREKNLGSTKGGLLAALHFIVKWKYYLQHRRFLLRTDHQSLKWLYSMEEPRGMVARWLNVLSDYDFTIVHRPGKKHGNADALSRAPVGREPSTDDPPIFDHDFLAVLAEEENQMMVTDQQNDEVLSEVRGWVR